MRSGQGPFRCCEEEEVSVAELFLQLFRYYIDCCGGLSMAQPPPLPQGLVVGGCLANDIHVLLYSQKATQPPKQLTTTTYTDPPTKAVRAASEISWQPSTTAQGLADGASGSAERECQSVTIENCSRTQFSPRRRRDTALLRFI